MNTFRRLIVVNRLVVLCISLAAVVLLSSCGARKSDNSLKADVAPLRCVVLLPTAVHYEEENKINEEYQEMQDGALFLDKVIRDELEQSNVPRIVETAQLRLQIDDIAGSPNGTIEDIGREAQCGNILMTSLIRFEQRQGGEYAVDSPASAAFEMKLINAGSGRSMWATTFSETQSSLMSNLFTFDKAKSRGFRWITVEELTAQGVHEKLRNCPYFF
ncbi:hypothetical protein [Desulfopila inferna]|uniref:hypothetical protein n=1 Tax=Desulfopila inferna TaxID=468528 RepID=UPI001963D675|nr:hypothetical protein [Desulfopila inferna]MBM9603384.1 hypothetical protein [Desulfopila inferna]